MRYSLFDSQQLRCEIVPLITSKKYAELNGGLVYVQPHLPE